MSTNNLAEQATSQAELWGIGDYGTIGRHLQLVADRLSDRLELGSGTKVLDVGAGTGNAAIAAARCGADVVAVDISSSLLDIARKRANKEGLDIEFMEADAQSLPFADESYDAVISTFGIMFAPDHQAAANEVLRVLKPGCKLGLANWSPEGVFGASGKTTAEFLPQDPAMASPAAWGRAPHLEAIFGPGIRFECHLRRIVYDYPSVDAYLDTLISSYPPTIRTFARLPAGQRQELRERLRELYLSWGLSEGEGFRLPMDYLEAVGQKSGAPRERFSRYPVLD